MTNDSKNPHLVIGLKASKTKVRAGNASETASFLKIAKCPYCGSESSMIVDKDGFVVEMVKKCKHLGDVLRIRDSDKCLKHFFEFEEIPDFRL